MRGKLGKQLRQEGAIKRIELMIERYEEILPAEKEQLKLMRKEKDIPPNNIPTMEKKVNQFEQKLERAQTTVKNTKKSLNR
jgi:predicted transcriptional regulator|tara:strand:- start:78 stop:320 length:243 start_codon:yes stop_codon:yes gene_type:complete